MSHGNSKQLAAASQSLYQLLQTTQSEVSSRICGCTEALMSSVTTVTTPYSLIPTTRLERNCGEVLPAALVAAVLLPLLVDEHKPLSPSMGKVSQSKADNHINTT
jgi:hypothetical protein